MTYEEKLARSREVDRNMFQMFLIFGAPIIPPIIGCQFLWWLFPVDLMGLPLVPIPMWGHLVGMVVLYLTVAGFFMMLRAGLNHGDPEGPRIQWRMLLIGLGMMFLLWAAFSASLKIFLSPMAGRW